MNQVYLRFLRLLFCFIYSININAQWQKTNGPGSNMVVDLVEHKGKLFLGTEGGVYFSTDSGMTWTYTSQDIENPRGLYYLISTPTNLIAAGLNGIYLSSDEGISWSQHSSGMSAVNEMAINNSSIFAGTEFDLVKRSTDGGQTWVSIGTGTLGSLVGSVCIHNNNVYANSQSSIAKSVDNGNNWQSISPQSVGLPQFSAVNSISSVDSLLFVFMSNNGLYVSNNDAQSFTAINTGFPAATTISVEHVISKDQILFAGLMGAGMPIYKSLDGGQTWTVSSTGMKYGDGVRRFFIYNDKLFASTGRGLYVSEDNGDNWTLTISGITNGFVDAIASNSSYLFAGLANRSQGGTQSIYRSSDNGENWEAINNGFSSFNVKTIYADDSVLIVSGNNSILYRSIDNGNSWLNVGLANNITSNTIGIVKANNKLFILTENNGIFYSNDNGLSWLYLSSSSSLNPLGYAIGSDGDTVFVAAGNFTYQSNDMGATWINTGLISASTYGTVFHCNGEYVYMGTRNNGVFRRLKTSTNWLDFNNSLSQPCWVTAIASRNDSIFIGTDYSSNSYTGKVYVITNFGNNWSFFNQGLPVNIGIRSLIVNYGNLFVGTGSLYNIDGRSIWKRSLSNANNTSLEKELFINSYSIYPNPSNGYVNFRNNGQIDKIQVFDLSGVLLFENQIDKGIDDVKLDLTFLANGLYFTTFQSNQKQFGSHKISIVK